MSRATYLQITDVRLLQDWGSKLRSVFTDDLLSGMPYLVGSALDRPDYRDVDVRLILSDDVYDRLASVVDVMALNLAYSLWGQRVTGLPIDFQVQRMTEANAENPAAGRRHPIGMGWP